MEIPDLFYMVSYLTHINLIILQCYQ